MSARQKGKHGPDLASVKQALVDNVKEIAIELFGEPTPESKRSKNWMFPGTGGVSICVDGPKKGLFCCLGDKRGGTLLDGYILARGGSLRDAILWAANKFGLSSEPAPPADPIIVASRVAAREKQRAKAEAADKANKRSQIGFATRLAQHAVPVAGTIAEQYLASRGIVAPPCGWPDSVRWHATNATLLVVSTAENGSTSAVQQIYLTPDAVKISKEESRRLGLEKGKRTNGSLGSAAVRLPAFKLDGAAALAGALLLAEGPETGMSGWIASGAETWIALGGFANLPPLPIGRLVIRCTDDDSTKVSKFGQETTSEDKLAADVARWADSGADIRAAWPWPERRRDGSDINDTLKADGAAAVLARLLAAERTGPEPAPPPPPMAPHFPRPMLSGTVARRGIKRYAMRVFDRVEQRIRAKEWIDERVRETRDLSAADYARRKTGATSISEIAIAAESPEAQRAGYRVARLRAKEEAERLFGKRAARGDPFSVLFKGSAGLGKTWAIISAYVRHPFLWSKNINIYMPQNSLSQQAAIDANKALEHLPPNEHGDRPRVLVLRGRDHADEAGQTLCHKDRLAVVAAAQRAGLSVYSSCCKTPANDEYPESLCPFHNWCVNQGGYLGQFDGRPALRLLAHQQLAVPQPTELRMPTPDLGAVDESPTAALKGESVIEPGWLRDPENYANADSDEQFWAIATGEAVLRAFTDPEQARPIARIQEDGFTAETLRAAATCTAATYVPPAISAGMPAGNALERLKTHKTTHGSQIAKLFRQVARDIDNFRHNSLAIEYDATNVSRTDDGTCIPHPVFRRHYTRDINVPDSSDLMLIDADGDIEANRAMFGRPNMRQFKLNAIRNAHVVQVKNHTFATSSLAPSEQIQNEAAHEKAAVLRGKITMFILGLVASGKHVLVVSTLPVRRAFTDEGEPHLPYKTQWFDADFTHFGAFLGKNDWKAYDAVVIIGREQMPARAVERILRAIIGNVKGAEIILTGKFGKEMRRHDLRYGDSEPVEVAVHADPRVQALVEIKREGQIGQAADRLRLIINEHRTAPAEVFILTNIPVPGIVVDSLVDFDDLLAGGTCWERAMARMTDDVLPLIPNWLSENHRDLFGCQRTAASNVAKLTFSNGIIHLRDLRGKNASPHIYIICQVAFFRLEGQRCPSKALIRHGKVDSRRAIERTLGKPVVDFRWADQQPSAPFPADPSSVAQPAHVTPHVTATIVTPTAPAAATNGTTPTPLAAVIQPWLVPIPAGPITAKSGIVGVLTAANISAAQPALDSLQP